GESIAARSSEREPRRARIGRLTPLRSPSFPSRHRHVNEAGTRSATRPVVGQDPSPPHADGERVPFGCTISQVRGGLAQATQQTPGADFHRPHAKLWLL